LALISKPAISPQPYDLIIHAESASDGAMTKFLLTLASKGNVRTTTVKVFGHEESDKIIAAVV
jgi:uncharacterized protein with GYD domain